MRKTLEERRLAAVKSRFIIFPTECHCCEEQVTFEKMWIVKTWGVNKTVHPRYYCKKCMRSAEEVVNAIETDKYCFGIAFVDTF